MQGQISSLIAGMLVAQFVYALPEFNGMLKDDHPRYSGDAIHGKNLNAGILDIEDLVLGDDEMVIRIYDVGNLPFKKGGYPADLKEIHVEQDVVSMLWYPTCSNEPETADKPVDEAWRLVQEMKFVSIKDYRNISDYPQILDGNFFIVQIKTAGAFREFAFSNPDAHVSTHNFRFMESLRAIDVFDEAACSYPGFVPRI